MRSLFISPSLHNHPRSNRLLQQPSHCSQKCAIARILHPCATGATPQRCFPPPARSPVPRLPRSGPRPTVTRSQGARHAAPPSLPRAAARSHRAPSPEYRPAAARTHWARLVRIAPTACRRPHRIYPTACRHPRHPPHLSPRVAAAPGPWLARTAPYASLFRRMREKGPLPGNIRPKCMLSEIKMATSSPHASVSGRNRAIQDAWRANLAAKGPFSRRGARNHAWREDVASAARPFRGSGMRHAAWPNGPCALRRGPGLLAACAPPAVLLVSAVACASPPSRPRSSPPSYTRRASPSETLHAVPVPMHLAICAPHPSRQPRGPTASRKQAEQRKQLNAGIKIGSPNGDPIEEFFGFAQRLPDALQPLHQANELALSYLDHSTRQRLRGYVIGLSGNSFTVDLYAALVDHATSIAR